ncbi:alpha/beta fold hydrolase [Novosphingobium rosa]|uniref:alpha/beta fold hydrolase n=1 Tax=Novosphingobium rosa TaxID=76978 RepID=UPI000830EF02|nr:alpha/beta hydrolase [Novosphingobium rosa]
MPSVTTTDLDQNYEELGAGDGKVVLLLHGWPDDASTWTPIAKALTLAGHRVIVPAWRGFGQTFFLHDAVPRHGNSALLAMDMIALLDALQIERFAVAGHDWGSNVAEALAVGWPARVERLAMLSTPPRLGGMLTPSFEQAQRYWYHWFMATPRGEQAVREDRHGFAHVHWVNWAPGGWFDEETFTRVAKSFDNPDWVEVTLHSYRSRWGSAEPDSRSVWLEDKVKATQTIHHPALFIKGDEDGVTCQSSFDPVPSKFSGPFELIGLPGIGHFPTREAPATVTDLLLRFFSQAIVRPEA